MQIEISSLINLIFSLFQTWILQAKAGRKIQLGKKNPVQTRKKNQVYQTPYFKQDILKMCRLIGGKDTLEKAGVQYCIVDTP